MLNLYVSIATAFVTAWKLIKLCVVYEMYLGIIKCKNV